MRHGLARGETRGGFRSDPLVPPAPSRSDARERIDPPRRVGGNPGPGTIAPPAAAADLHAEKGQKEAKGDMS